QRDEGLLRKVGPIGEPVRRYPLLFGDEAFASLENERDLAAHHDGDGEYMEVGLTLEKRRLCGFHGHRHGFSAMGLTMPFSHVRALNGGADGVILAGCPHEGALGVEAEQ